MLKVGDKLMYDGKVATVRYYDCAGVYVSEQSIGEGLFDLTWERAYEGAWKYQKQVAEKAMRGKSAVIINTKTLSKENELWIEIWNHLKTFLESSQKTEIEYYGDNVLVDSRIEYTDEIKISAVLREMEGLERFVR
ncbi:hypothetical protein [Macrococcoides bohemicum]|uniref:hypothetical protein n=1 Tax=Macrococcoides bohemicum TaxID=1903056 RepID=UPI00165D9D93|nr:hypothetical protein [Macrococcus bohemicus]MBC9873676.1 hypothetical protein [Macrococcus bohemicus]